MAPSQSFLQALSTAVVLSSGSRGFSRQAACVPISSCWVQSQTSKAVRCQPHMLSHVSMLLVVPPSTQPVCCELLQKSGQQP